jgi:hypothetical protein
MSREQFGCVVLFPLAPAALIQASLPTHMQEWVTKMPLMS